MSNSREITFDYCGTTGVLFHKIVSIKTSDSGESPTVYRMEHANQSGCVKLTNSVVI